MRRAADLLQRSRREQSQTERPAQATEAIKTSHSGVHLSYDSALPKEVKMSVATEQFRRATLKRNASTEQGRERGISKIENLLKQNGYPEDVITRTKELSERRRNDRENKYDSILKVPFIMTI